MGYYFPKLNTCILSAKLHMSQKEDSELMKQEIFKIKKLVLTAKKQMDGK